MAQTNFYARNFNDCWPPVSNQVMWNPDSWHWHDQFCLSRRQFDMLPITQEEWQEFESYFMAWDPNSHTWKALYEIYKQACNNYLPGMTMAELAHRVGILPELSND